MLVVDNFDVNIRYTYTQFFSYVLKNCMCFMLSNCVNEKNMYMFYYMFFKSNIGLNAKKKRNTFVMRNTQYSIELSVHKQPSVFNTTHTIQCCVNFPNISFLYYCL